jgi:hypothetical protein
VSWWCRFWNDLYFILFCANHIYKSVVLIAPNSRSEGMHQIRLHRGSDMHQPTKHHTPFRGGCGRLGGYFGAFAPTPLNPLLVHCGALWCNV